MQVTSDSLIGWFRRKFECAPPWYNSSKRLPPNTCARLHTIVSLSLTPFTLWHCVLKHFPQLSARATLARLCCNARQLRRFVYLSLVSTLPNQSIEDVSLSFRILWHSARRLSLTGIWTTSSRAIVPTKPAPKEEHPQECRSPLITNFQRPFHSTVMTRTSKTWRLLAAGPPNLHTAMQTLIAN